MSKRLITNPEGKVLNLQKKQRKIKGSPETRDKLGKVLISRENIKSS